MSTVSRNPFPHRPRDPARIERMLDLLRTAWEREPDTRLLQLLINAAPPKEPVPALYHVEDDELEAVLRGKLGLDAEDEPDAPRP